MSTLIANDRFVDLDLSPQEFRTLGFGVVVGRQQPSQGQWRLGATESVPAPRKSSASNRRRRRRCGGRSRG